jgi:hypothetical protein
VPCGDREDGGGGAGDRRPRSGASIDSGLAAATTGWQRCSTAGALDRGT